jgi:hypothetical protein
MVNVKVRVARLAGASEELRMPPAIIAAAIATTGSLLASSNASKAAKSAANTEYQATQDNIAENRREFDAIQANNAPFRDIGVSALGALGVQLRLVGLRPRAVHDQSAGRIDARPQRGRAPDDARPVHRPRNRRRHAGDLSRQDGHGARSGESVGPADLPSLRADPPAKFPTTTRVRTASASAPPRWRPRPRAAARAVRWTG